MLDAELIDVLERVRSGVVTPDQAAHILRAGPFRRSSLEFADVDHHRSIRLGLSEVIYGEGKTIEQILSITERLTHSGSPVLITRLDAEKLSALKQQYPQGRANDTGRTFIVNPHPGKDSSSGEPYVAVLAAGTADMYVAEEASEVCVAMSTAVEKFYDVGVAGLHRLLNKTEEIQGASALVVVAGMEGALPSVVGGLFGKPLFAVPTSVGYGASFGGVAALLAMVNSCAPGVAVVNIDNGFSAGFAACQVIKQILKNRDE